MGEKGNMKICREKYEPYLWLVFQFMNHRQDSWFGDNRGEDLAKCG